jgi:pimeloyl-ACP methyl ester carboxylesterase
MEEIIEIRHGRHIFYRQVLLEQKQQHHEGLTLNDDLLSNNSHPDPPSVIHMVFVHGTCASSAQFNSLLVALDELLQTKLKDDQEKENDNVGTIKLRTVRIVCHLYDAISCGSSPFVQNWDAYHTEESIQDLHAILERRKIDTRAMPTILVGHSYAPTILIRYLSTIVSETNDMGIKGCTFLSSAMSGELNPIPNGGHPIFSLPVFVLRCLQPMLNKAFLKLAYHPNTSIRLIEEAQASNSQNNMYMAKAFHVHQQWATKEECAALHEIPVLVIHGKDDKVLPNEAGMCLADAVRANEFVIVEETSHQVMQEKPNEVAKHILKFLTDINLL